MEDLEEDGKYEWEAWVIEEAMYRAAVGLGYWNDSGTYRPMNNETSTAPSSEASPLE